MTHEILTHTLETMGNVAERKPSIPPTILHGKALEAIRRLTVNAVPPSYTELGLALGVASRGQINRMLRQMRDRGLVDFEDGRARSLRIVGELSAMRDRSTAELLKIRENIDRILISRPPA